MNFKDELKFYYQHVFPVNAIWKWLQYESDKNVKGKIQYREFAFNLESGCFYRYRSFNSPNELKSHLLKNIPVKIHVGGEYYVPPKPKRLVNLDVFQRELIFDLDLSDFDDIRKCCKNNNVCSKCWKFIRAACKILDSIMREDFGFRHLLWVFSGGRGIHLWVCDSEARAFSNPERACIINYVSLQEKRNDSFRRHFKKEMLNPCLRRAVEIIDQYFREICLEDQKILETEEDLNKFLANVSNMKLRSELRKILQPLRNSKQRWHAFGKYYQENIIEFYQSGSKYLIEELKVIYVYPRFDFEVTKMKDHVLKLPFVVHPSSKKISVVFDVDEIDNFDPIILPSLSKVLACNPYDVQNSQLLIGEKILEKNVFLKKSLEVFKRFIEEME